MHTIAIVKLIENIRYDDYESYTDIVAASITEWEEVDDEKFALLRKAVKAAKDHAWETQFEVIEKLKTDSPDIVNAVDQYIAMVEKKAAKAAAAKAKREAEAEKKRLAQQRKTKEQRKALLKELQKEFGEGK